LTASHLLASGTTVIADTAALTKYLVSIAGGLSVAAGFAATTLRRDLQKIQQLVPVQSEAMAAVAASDPVLAAYVTQCRDGMVMPSYPEMRDAWRLLGQTEYDVLAGIGDPRERAGRAADEGWRMLEAARAGA
jgi:maltose-binding protein MalE